MVDKKERSVPMKDRKLPPHQQMTMKDNGLTSTQEVLYPSDFKRADKATGKKVQTNKK